MDKIKIKGRETGLRESDYPIYLKAKTKEGVKIYVIEKKKNTKNCCMSATIEKIEFST